ncbi:uncharacterized protein LOC127135977 [Lathyrus oleraceus]|uniref:uncharacterized protein LOC127135977 n=1 Tax=Pisum sativum TaxID=3888 RepID=UPI0021CF4DA5|nr:uncharacterized protein LOC127135977 [Pisum sativum]
MTCERSGKYRTPLRNLKRDDTSSRKYGHPSVCRLIPEEKECVLDMTLNLVQLKNILATLKQKQPENISNIKQVYLTCKDGVSVRYIFLTRPDSIKLSNMFPTVLILYPTYKTNKFRLPLLEMALEMCRTLLKDQGKMSKEIVIDRDTVLMSSVATVFPYSNALLYRKVCEKYPDLLEYVGSTILDQVKKKIVCAWNDNVRHLGNTITNKVKVARAILKIWLVNIGSISREGLNYIFHGAKRVNNVGFVSTKCGCTIVKTYGLTCACNISKKVRLGDLIKMDEVCIHRKRLRFDDDDVMNDGKSNISILIEWEVIQEIFLKVDDNTKLHIKEQLRNISYSETTNMKLPSQPVKTKGALKKLKPTPNDNSTTRSPSYFEHVDKVFPDPPTLKFQKSVAKEACISKPPLTSPPPKIPFIDEMPIFMHKYIERIINVKGGSN